MGKRQQAQIEALERDNARLASERDKAREELARLYATRTPAPETLGDVARREFNDRWGWLLDLAGFGR